MSHSSPSHAFNLRQFDRFDLQAQVIGSVLKVAEHKGIISKELAAKFNGEEPAPETLEKVDLRAAQLQHKKDTEDRLSNPFDTRTEPQPATPDAEENEPAVNLLHTAMQFREARTPEAQAECFKKLQQQVQLTSDELSQLGKLMTLLVPALESTSTVQESANPLDSAIGLFKEYLLSGLKKDASGKNAYGMEPEQWMDALAKAKDKLILSLVTTAHPWNFLTPEGRDYQQSFISALRVASGYSGTDNADIDAEDIAAFDKRARRVIPGYDKTNAAPALTQTATSVIENVVAKACDAINAGKPLTYVNKVTVGAETETEKDIINVVKPAMAAMQQSWNLALGSKAVRDAAATLGADTKQKLHALLLNDDDKKRTYEQRSWIRAGADKDGRHESTDVAFYSGYMDSLDENGVYRGPILDLRENAEIRKKAIGGFIASRYKEDKNNFRQICDDFCREQEQKTGKPLGEHWSSPKVSLFQHLSEENQSAFLQYLLEHGENLFNRREIRSETLGFNENFYPVYKQLLKDYKLDPHTPYGSLSSEVRDELLNRMSEVEGEFVSGHKVEDPITVTGGYDINRVITKINSKATIVGFNYKHDANKNALLIDKYTTDGNGGTRQLNAMESMECSSYIRRLFLVNKVVDEQKQHGVMVVEREQAANFENPSDFFAQLYLYQQTGLITLGDVERNGEKHKEVVAMPKIGIMPLFETTPDMRRGPEILRNILSTPLGRSYYEQRGKAEIMVGYSDGAKSGGNFASHWRIRQFEKQAIAAFKETFGPDYEVRFLRGPGRGENRGGTRRYDRQYLLHDDSANITAVNDQTIQADLPVRMQMDPKFAERTLAEFQVSALSGAVEAQREKSELEKKRQESFDRVIGFLVSHSEEHYRTGIFDKVDETETFLKTVTKNPDASSRMGKRADTAQRGIGPQRAITVELATNIAGMPLHDYGLKRALEDYMNGNAVETPAVLDEKGNEVRGEAALMILARDCSFFREEMKLATLRQQSLNPVLAEHWTQRMEAQIDKDNEKAKTPKPADEINAAKQAQRAFTQDVLKELGGLGELCQSLLQGKKVHTRMTREDYSGEPYAEALATIGNAVCLAHPTLADDTAKHFYLAMQNPISNRPASEMAVRTPGVSK